MPEEPAATVPPAGAGAVAMAVPMPTTTIGKSAATRATAAEAAAAGEAAVCSALNIASTDASEKLFESMVMIAAATVRVATPVPVPAPIFAAEAASIKVTHFFLSRTPNRILTSDIS